jgi:hypothetical protein
MLRESVKRKRMDMCAGWWSLDPLQLSTVCISLYGSTSLLFGLRIDNFNVN